MFHLTTVSMLRCLNKEAHSCFLDIILNFVKENIQIESVAEASDVLVKNLRLRLFFVFQQGLEIGEWTIGS